VNQYREGKVKRTPRRGVKKYLKLCAYKRSKQVASIKWQVASGERNSLRGGELKDLPNSFGNERSAAGQSSLSILRKKGSRNERAE